MPNFRLLGSIIIKKYPKVVDTLDVFFDIDSKFTIYFWRSQLDLELRMVKIIRKNLSIGKKIYIYIVYS